MNCKHCGASVNKHKAGYVTDVCVSATLGESSTKTWTEHYSEFVFSELLAGIKCMLPIDYNLRMESTYAGWCVSGECPHGATHYKTYAETLPLALCRMLLSMEEER